MLGFSIGLIAGAMLGVTIMALMFVAGRSDDD